MPWRKKEKLDQQASTQEHILVRAVRDQVLILRTGDMTAVVEVAGIDFTRLPDDARTGLVAQFENFLLTLRFPYQFVIARQRQRLEEYLAYLQDQAQKHAGMANQAYATHLYGWADFMLEVVERVNPQIPLYLISLPYDPIAPQERARRRFELSQDRYRRGLEELQHRSDQVVRGLMRVGLASRRLQDQELVAILHRVYHPSVPDYRIPPTARVKSLIAEMEGLAHDVA